MSLSVRRHSGATKVASGPTGKAIRFIGWRGRDRGSMAVLCAVMIPVLVGFGVLTINQGYVGYRTLLLRQTVQAAALAAGDNLGSYYSTASSTTLTNFAQTIAQANMPTAQYGTVVSSVAVGTWSGTAFTSGGSSPNAVQVTGSNTVPLFLGSWFGKPNVTISSTATASYASGRSFNTIVINDLSQSFSSEISNQKAVDNSILNCVKGAAGSTSTFGITSIDGHATILQPLTQASTNLTLLQTFIGTLAQCGSLLMPACSGSNVASGIYSAIQQFSGSAYKGTNKNIVIITDGVPNASSGVTYSAADGVTCTTNCTDAILQTGAQTQAAAAKAAGISISTIYYSGDTATQNQSTYSTYLASLVTGTGIAMVAPTASQINTAYAGFCSTIPSALKMVN